MDKIWTFLGGMLAGAASVVATAVVADTLTNDESGQEKPKGECSKLLSLPEGADKTN